MTHILYGLDMKLGLKTLLPFFFKILFLCGPFFLKVFIEFVTILLLFYVLVFWP